MCPCFSMNNIIDGNFIYPKMLSNRFDLPSINIHLTYEWNITIFKLRLRQLFSASLNAMITTNETPTLNCILRIIFRSAWANVEGITARRVRAVVTTEQSFGNKTLIPQLPSNAMRTIRFPFPIYTYIEKTIAFWPAACKPFPATIGTFSTMLAHGNVFPKSLRQRRGMANAGSLTKNSQWIFNSRWVTKKDSSAVGVLANTFNMHAQPPHIESGSTGRRVRRLTSVELLAWRAADPSRAPIYYNRKAA